MSDDLELHAVKVEPMLYTCNTVFQSAIGETWCTFPNDLFNRLPDEKKKEMFKRIQSVIDEYATNDA